GWQKVKLTVSNGYGSHTAVDSHAVYISLGNVIHDAPFYEDFERPESFEEWVSINYNNTRSYFQPTSTAARSGNHCLMVNNYKRTRQSDLEEIISPALNMSNVQNMTMSFYYSLASADQNFNTGSVDTIKVFASTDCGNTWLLQYRIGGPRIVNAGYMLSQFKPTAGFYWRRERFTLTNNIKRPNVIFKIQYKSSLLSNNLYLDDINIGDALVSDVENLQINEDKLNVFPNPSNGSATVYFFTRGDEKVELSLYDVNGKLVTTLFEGFAGEGDNRIDLNSQIFPTNGVYFLKLKTNYGSYTTRAVITK
ncbi:MAG: T9SS type A sorting domain-containing protein, partial [Chitinophagales bacterium]|nr:T9SS type A sorting domain-containing protein [Chitinophagales bacterium]